MVTSGSADGAQRLADAWASDDERSKVETAVSVSRGHPKATDPETREQREVWVLVYRLA